jgi:Arc/MetJ-type ribon-helix-helix transcriptional regulator
MQIVLKRSDLVQFIDELVKTGRYPSPEAVVEAAIADLRDNSGAEFDDETVAAINEAEAQADRGEGIDLDHFREHMNKRMSRG